MSSRPSSIHLHLQRYAFYVLLICVVPVQAAWDFTTLNSRAQQLYHFSVAAQSRLNELQALIERYRGQGETSQLEAVNHFFNETLMYQDDTSLWGTKDYWATPLEALSKGAGDCEDYALSKYFVLRELGVPNEKLRITYVKAIELKQAHMVLTYYPQPTATPLVLDNLIEEIRPASTRKDLEPVYAFNAESVWVSKGMQQPKHGTKSLSRWVDLRAKMRSEGFPVDNSEY